MSNCKTCGAFFVNEFHKCPPIWLCWIEYNQEECDAREVHAYSADAAAEKYAEDYDSDSGEYSIVSGRAESVCVVKDRAGKILRFALSGESVPRYSATEIPSTPLKGR